MLKRQYKGDSSACHPCREYFVLTADTFRSYCCLLLPRGFRKSCGVNEKAGRGGGDRTQIPDKPLSFKDWVEDLSPATSSEETTGHTGLVLVRPAQDQHGGSSKSTYTQIVAPCT